jgi:acetyltransferase-like isoleucine patch superfamily enzyme
MTPWVMLGHHALFGDYVDAIHSVGGYLRLLVINRPDLAGTGEQGIHARHARYQAWLARRYPELSTALTPVEEFSPQHGDHLLFGFRGLKILPWREEVRERWGVLLPPLVHRTAYVSPFAQLGEGVFVGAQCAVAANAVVGELTLLNRAASLGHDARVARCCVLGPSSALASGVRLEEGAVVGIGAVVLEDRVIGASAVVGAAALVTRDVAPGVTVIGLPAAPRSPRVP